MANSELILGMNLREEVKASACLGTGSGELSNPLSSLTPLVDLHITRVI